MIIKILDISGHHMKTKHIYTYIGTVLYYSGNVVNNTAEVSTVLIYKCILEAIWILSLFRIKIDPRLRKALVQF